MKVAVFSAKRYDREMLGAANAEAGHELVFFDHLLDSSTVALAAGAGAVCVFVNDRMDAPVLEALANGGVGLVALRCTGFNNVDLKAAARLAIKVVRVTDYSPYSVAEHAVALILALNRKIPRAYNRTRDGNFELDGLMGRDLHGQTVGVIGTGKIGRVFAHIMAGFGCSILGFDPYPDPEFEALGGRYAPVTELAERSDIISLHCPLTPETHHLVNAGSLARGKRGAMLINTSRGGLVDTEAVIEGLKSGQIGGLGLDVYEQESDLFFQDLSGTIIADDMIQRLVSFPNVIVTGHQAFLHPRSDRDHLRDDDREHCGLRGGPPPGARDPGDGLTLVAALRPLEQRIQRDAPADPGDGEDQQVDQLAGRQQAAQGDRAPDPGDQENQDADHGDEASRARAHQRLFRNRKKPPSARMEATIDHSTQSHWSIVATANTRTARNQPAMAATPDTSEVANRPRRPVTASASQARKKAPRTAMTMSAYCKRASPDCGDRTPKSDSISPSWAGIPLSQASEQRRWQVV